MKPYNREKQYDINMLFVMFIFAVVSCLYIFYAQQQPQYDGNFVTSQVIYYVLGFTLALVVLHFDFEYYLSLNWFLYGFGLLLLVALALAPESIAPDRSGAVRWFDLGVGPALQPSEFMKIFIIITLSTVIYKHNNKFTPKLLKNDLWLLCKMGLVILPPILLFRDQPDMGMVMMTLAIFVGLVLISGISYRLITILFGVPMTIFLAFIFAYFRFPEFVQTYIFDHLPGYQVDRFHGWLQPLEYSDDGYQVAQAMTAIGSGGMTGGNHHVIIPEAHTDFIFSVVGMETGFIGTAFIITLYFILFYQIMMTAIRSHHSFGTYLCAGVIALFTFQVFQNVGMNVGILPVTGFTLPLMSYGGSSLLSSMLALGIVLGVRYHSKSYFFEEE